MLVTILQILFRFILKSIVIFGIVFMVICAVFVIVSIVHGDIKIKIARNNAENKDK